MHRLSQCPLIFSQKNTLIYAKPYLFSLHKNLNFKESLYIPYEVNWKMHFSSPVNNPFRRNAWYLWFTYMVDEKKSLKDNDYLIT